MSRYHAETLPEIKVLPLGLRPIEETVASFQEGDVCLLAAVLSLAEETHESEVWNFIQVKGSGVMDAITHLGSQTSLISFGGKEKPKSFGPLKEFSANGNGAQVKVVTVPIAPIDCNLTDLSVVADEQPKQVMLTSKELLAYLSKGQLKDTNSLSTYLCDYEASLQQRLLGIINRAERKSLASLSHATTDELTNGLLALEAQLVTDAIRLSELPPKEGLDEIQRSLQDYPPDADTLLAIMGLSQVDSSEKLGTLNYLRSRKVIHVIRQWRGAVVKTMNNVISPSEPVTKQTLIPTLKKHYEYLSQLSGSERLKKYEQITQTLLGEVALVYGLEVSEVKLALRWAQELLMDNLNEALMAPAESNQIYDLANENKNENVFNLLCLAMGLNFKEETNLHWKRYAINQSRQVLGLAEVIMRRVLPIHKDYRPDILNLLLKEFTSSSAKHMVIESNQGTIHSIERRVKLISGDEIPVIVDEGEIKEPLSTLRKLLSSTKPNYFPKDLGRVSFVLNKVDETQREHSTNTLITSIYQKACELFGDDWEVELVPDDRDPFELVRRITRGEVVPKEDIKGNRNGSKSGLLLRRKINLIFTPKATDSSTQMYPTAIEVVVYPYLSVQDNELLRNAGLMGYVEKLGDDETYSAERWVVRDDDRPLVPVLAELLLWLLPYEKRKPLFNKSSLQYA